MKNKYRYDIDPALVKASTDKKIAEHAKFMEEFQSRNHRFFENRPEDWTIALADMIRIYDNFSKRELNYYSTVRIIRLKYKRGKKFVLVYGDINDADVATGTGPFASAQEAQNWFTMGRR